MPGLPPSLRGAPASRLGALVVLALVIVAVAWRVVPAFDWVDGEIDKTSGLTRLDRELAPARAVDIDPRPIEAAAAVLPPDATFTVLVGESYPFTHSISALTTPAWATYRLMPRRGAVDPTTAEWVISYGADLGAHGFTPVETIDLGLGVTLARIK